MDSSRLHCCSCPAQSVRMIVVGRFMVLPGFEFGMGMIVLRPVVGMGMRGLDLPRIHPVVAVPMSVGMPVHVGMMMPVGVRMGVDQVAMAVRMLVSVLVRMGVAVVVLVYMLPVMIILLTMRVLMRQSLSKAHGPPG